MSHSDDEEFDRRFQALIRAEFGDVAGAGPPGRNRVDSVPES